MFLAFNYKILNLDETLFEVSIDDTEFKESIWIEVDRPAPIIAYISSIIKIYSGRNLNVSKNLFRVFQFQEKRLSWKMKNQIEYCLHNIPEYEQYHNDVKKFLLWI